jgi:hypothetical protein
MSGMGMFAAALGGAAGAINQQAVGDIEQQRKTDLMQVQAELERSKLKFAETLRQGGVRADFNFVNDKGTVATRQATARSNTLAAGQDTRDAKVAEAGDTAYQGAVKGQADREAADTAARARATTKANAADGDYLGAMTKLKLADPSVAAQIARDRAAAGESGARAGLIGVQAEAGRVEIADKNKLTKLYDEASGILSDANLTDEERAKKFAKVQQQIVLVKSKNGTGTAARDPELDTQTEEVTRINPDGSTSKVTSKTVRKPGSIGADAGTGPTVGQEVDGFVFKGGDPKDKNNWTPKTADKQQGPGAQAKPAPSPKQAARDEYLRELKVLEDMKSGLLPKAQGNEREIAVQEEKVNRLLRAAS